MNHYKYFRYSRFLLIITFIISLSATPSNGTDLSKPDLPIADSIKEINLLYHDRNYLDAYQLSHHLLIDREHFDSSVMETAVYSLQRLHRQNDIDTFIDNVLNTHKSDWRSFKTSGYLYDNILSHYGYLMGGSFIRGRSRNYRSSINITEHDHLQALACYHESLKLILNSAASDSEISDLYYTIADSYIKNIYPETAIRLLIKSDYQSIPPYSQTLPYANLYGNGAPVTRENKPLFFKLPKNTASALNDGELFRYYLHKSSEYSNSRTRELQTMAKFSQSLFGVQTLAPQLIRDASTDTFINDLPELADNQSIARLETGINKFTLDNSYSYLIILKELAKTSPDIDSLFTIAIELENRRRYSEAAEYWRQLLALPDLPVHTHDTANMHLKQIEDSFVKFESSRVQSNITAPSLWLRYRNAANVHIRARKLNTERLLSAVTTAIRSNPNSPEPAPNTIRNIGWLLTNDKYTELLGSIVYDSVLPLPEPELLHADSKTEIHLPDNLTGDAYFVEAILDNGHKANILLWLSDLTITSRLLSSGDRLYFSSDSDTGRSISDVSINVFAASTRRIHLGKASSNPPIIETAIKTGTDGIALLSKDYLKPDYNYLITATTTDGRRAFIGFNHLFRDTPKDNTKRSHRQIYFSDKPLYKAGEEIEIAGWLRDYNYSHTEETPADNPDSFVAAFYNPLGEKVSEQEVPVDKNGSFSFTFQSTASSQLGIWSIKSDLDIAQSGNYFRIEEYVKPEFTADLTPLTANPVLSKPMELRLKAEYNFGKPLQNARVEYEIQRTPSPTLFQPAHRWDWLYGKGYQRITGSTNAALDFHLPPPYPTESKLIARASTYTDKSGNATIRFNPDPENTLEDTASCSFTIKATVTDSSNRHVDTGTSLIIQKTEFSLDIQTDQNYYYNNEEITLQVTPYSGNSPITTELHSNINIDIIHIDQNQNRTTIKSLKDIPQDNNFIYSSKFPLKHSGYYIIECTANDNSGNQITSTADLFIADKSGDINITIPHDKDLTILPKKKEYNLSDNAEILIISPTAPTSLLLFSGITGNNIPMPQVIQTQNNTSIINYQITPSDIPNTYIEVLVTPKQSLLSTRAELIIPPVKQIANLTITPEQSEYQPGSTATVTLTATDSDNNPLSGQAILTVYDSALENITGKIKYSDIRKFFWGITNHPPHYPALTSIDKFSYNIYGDRTLPLQPIGLFSNTFSTPDTALPKSEMAMGNGILFDRMSAVSAPSTDSPDSKIRENFSTNAIIERSIIFDKDGKTKITIPLPDSITKWRIRAWIMTDTTHVAEAESSIATSKELMIIPSFPRYLVTGDTAIINYSVYNNSSTPKDIQLHNSVVSGLAIITPDPSNIRIEPNSHKTVSSTITAQHRSNPMITITAHSNAYKDSVAFNLPVLEKGQQLYRSKTTLLDSKSSSYNTAIDVPINIKPDSATLSFTIFPTITSILNNSLDLFSSDKINSNDNTIATLLPELLLTHFSKNTIRSNNKQLIIKLSNTIQSLQTLQNNDGGWSWIGKHDISSPYITALILRSLETIDSLGYTVPATVITNARLYLREHQASQITQLQNFSANISPSKQYPTDLDSLIYSVLSLSDNNILEMKKTLLDNKSHLSVMGLTFLATGLNNSDDSILLNQVMHNIEQYLSIDNSNNTAYLKLKNNRHWWKWYSSETQATANYLSLRLANDSENSSINNQLAHYLINNIRHTSRYDSIYTINAVFNSLLEYSHNNFDKSHTNSFTLTLNDSTTTISPLNTNDSPTVITYTAQDLITGNNSMSISFDNPTASPLYISHTLSYFSLDDIAKAHGLELKVTRNYYLLTPDNKTYSLPNGKGGTTEQIEVHYSKTKVMPDTVLSAGDLIEVELIIESSNDYEYLLIKDIKPACLEPVANISHFDYNGVSYYKEFRNNSVDFYAESLPRGTYSFSYKGYLLFSGDFTAKAATSEGVFATELNSNSNGFVFNVIK